ncbi:MAG TPA: thiamine-phosphate kinase [Gammaproteobacteria bacterium]|nr:thiamine-phosphate kinase [Gammaproteobacteria bacterium]
MAVSEFEIIARYFAAHPGRRGDVVLGIGDDAALLRVPPDQDLVLAVDTLVSGVHFPTDTAPEDIGYKALAVNLSDLAAMGAVPAWFSLALTLPEADEEWLAGFAGGLFELADAHGLALIGGDTTRGPLTVTVQVAGFVPSGSALHRAGARPGDIVCVTGTLGDAALGLQVVQGRLDRGPQDNLYLRQRLNRPIPRVSAGRALRERAHAGIDISDGLAADLGHLLEAGGVGVRLELDALPLSDAFRRYLADAPESEQALALALTGGDDYELCVCLAPEAYESLPALDVPLTRVGTVEAAAGLRCVDGAGRELAVASGGYRHFAT